MFIGRTDVHWKDCVHWKDWSWNSNTLATWCEELTHWKRPWCWERLKAGGEGHDRGWDGWMASLTQWTWVWVDSGSWWWTGRPGVLWFMGSQSVRHDWVTELNWTVLSWLLFSALIATWVIILPTLPEFELWAHVRFIYKLSCVFFFPLNFLVYNTVHQRCWIICKWKTQN